MSEALFVPKAQYDAKVRHLEEELGQAKEGERIHKSIVLGCITRGIQVTSTEESGQIKFTITNPAEQRCRVLERALEMAADDVRFTVLRHTDRNAIKNSWLEKAESQLKKSE